MSNQETPPENVIQGPWVAKDGRRVKLPDKDIIAARLLRQFADELAQNLAVQMIHTMGENGIDISENSFLRDMAMIIEMTHSVIYRDLELEHPAHKFMEEFVDITILPDNTVQTDVDFTIITELTDMLENVDDPEIS